MDDAIFRQKLAHIQTQLHTASSDTSLKISWPWFKDARLSVVQQKIAERINEAVERLDDASHCSLCHEDYVEGIQHALGVLESYLAGNLTKLVTVTDVTYTTLDRQHGISFSLMTLDGKVVVVSNLTGFTDELARELEKHPILGEIQTVNLPILIDGTEYLVQSITPQDVFYEEVRSFARPEIRDKLLSMLSKNTL